MKTFITETVQVHSAARKPGACSDRECNGKAAFRCALLVLLALGLLGGIGQAQEPLKIDPSGWVSIPALAVGVDETGKPRYHLLWRGGGLDLAETGVDDYRLFIQAGTGSVGIGTNSVPSKLSVGGSGYFSGNVGIGTNAAPSNLTVSGSVGIGTNSVPSKLSVAGNGYFSGNIGIGTKAAPSNLSVSGNVGIGKEPTTDKLSVEGNANFSGNVGIGGGQLYFTDKGATLKDNWIGPSKDNEGKWSLHIGGITSSDNLRRIYLAAHFTTVQGSLGIGTTEPKAQLEVASNAIFRGALYAEGGLAFKTQENPPKWRLVGYQDSFNANRQAAAPPAPSDTRLKTDLRPIPSALEKVSQLRGVTFRWNEQGLQYLTRDVETTLSAGPGASDEENRKLWQAERDKQYKELSKTNVGVLAQDVEAVLPQAVTTDASGYKLVNYTELIPLVIEALKEEDKISQEQARTIASQQTEIQRLTVANQAAQEQLNELQDVKQKLGLLEATVNRFLASGSSADADKTGTSELLAGARPSGPQ